MVNSEKFSVRLQKILDYYDISAAAFADAIDVGRSSISHILSGRNKPSLDFVLKIVQVYPEVELYWLLNGKGKFPASPETEEAKKKPSQDHLFSERPQEEIRAKEVPTPPVNAPAVTNSPVTPPAGRKIKKIVIFYEDGTFDAFEN